jgi:diacylglycerol kinase (ATP)
MPRWDALAMSSAFGPLAIIVNPKAGRGKVRTRLPEIERELTANQLDYEMLETTAPGEATRLARDALAAGGRFLVAVGGDGTVHEVVNGMVQDDRPVQSASVLGVVSAGSGCDFIRTFDLPANAVQAVNRLTGDSTRPLDVGRIRCSRTDGKDVVRYFANIAEVGLGGAVAGRAARLPSKLGPARYFFAFWLTLPGYRSCSARVEVDGEPAYEGRAVNVVVANCRFFGGGMRISPASDPGDGTFELQVFNGPKSDSFTTLPKVYAGRHLPHRNVVELSGGRFHVDADHPLAIEADGELLGTTPATVEVLPRLLTVKV